MAALCAAQVRFRASWPRSYDLGRLSLRVLLGVGDLSTWHHRACAELCPARGGMRWPAGRMHQNYRKAMTGNRIIGRGHPDQREQWAQSLGMLERVLIRQIDRVRLDRR